MPPIALTALHISPLVHTLGLKRRRGRGLCGRDEQEQSRRGLRNFKHSRGRARGGSGRNRGLSWYDTVNKSYITAWDMCEVCS